MKRFVKDAHILSVIAMLDLSSRATKDSIQQNMIQLEETDLVIQARAGVRTAQEALFRAHANRAYVVAQRYLGSRYDAADVVHDAFLKAFARLDQFNNERGAFVHWLSRIVANEALSWMRKEKIRFTEDVTDPILGNQLESSSGDPSFNPSLKPEYDDLLAALDILPAGARTVFNLSVFEGFSHDEIGDQLGITASASRAQLTRARHQLRSYLLPITQQP